MTKNGDELESVLSELNAFGKYQLLNFILICLPVFTSAIYGMAYIYSAGSPTYRCRIPECDGNNGTVFDSKWLKYSVPFSNSEPARCSRYNTVNTVNQFKGDSCVSEMFNVSDIIRCDDFVFKDKKEITIVNAFDLKCEENDWKLAMVGTLSSVGQFFGLMISGFMSDRYGRKIVLIVGAVSSGAVGIVKAVSWSYFSFIMFEVTENILHAGLYAGAFILGEIMRNTQFKMKSTINILIMEGNV